MATYLGQVVQASNGFGTFASSEFDAPYTGAAAAGDLILLAVHNRNGGAENDPTAVADDAGNTFTRACRSAEVGGLKVEVWTCVLAHPVTAANTVTITLAHTGDDSWLLVAGDRWQTGDGAVDVTVTTTSSTPPDTLSVGPTPAVSQARQIIYAVFAGYSNRVSSVIPHETFTAGAPYTAAGSVMTPEDAVNPSNFTNMWLYTEYQILTGAAGGYTATGTPSPHASTLGVEVTALAIVTIKDGGSHTADLTSTATLQLPRTQDLTSGATISRPTHSGAAETAIFYPEIHTVTLAHASLGADSYLAWRQLFFNNWDTEALRDLTTSAVLLAGNTKSLTTTAVTGFGGQKDLVSAASLSVTRQRDLTTTAGLTAPQHRDLGTDAALQARRFKDLSPKAVLTTTDRTDLTATAAISSKRTTDLPTTAGLKFPFTDELDTDAAIRANVHRDLPASGVVVRTLAASLTTDAALGRLGHDDLTTSATSQRQRNRDLAGSATVYVVQIPVVTSLSLVPETVSPIAVPTVNPTSLRVAINGRLFTTATDVLVDGVSVGAGNFHVFSDNTISFVVPPHAVGSVHVRVVTPDGISALTTADVMRYAVFPTLTTLTPNNGPPEGASTVITGSGFLASNLRLLFTSDGNYLLNPASYTVDSDHQITVHSLSGATTSEGSAAQIGTFQVVSDDGFTFFAGSPKWTWWPSVRVVAPSSGSPHGGVTVDIIGLWFNPPAGIQVSFGGVLSPHVTFLTTSHLQAVAPAHAGGTVDITVTTSRATSLAQLLDEYSYSVATVRQDLLSSAVIGSYPAPRPQAVQVFLTTGVRTGVKFIVPDAATAKLTDLMQ